MGKTLAGIELCAHDIKGRKRWAEGMHPIILIKMLGHWLGALT